MTRTSSISMNTCRTCLKTAADKDISDLENDINEDSKNCIEIMLFCLDIKIAQDPKITRKLCDNCYKKIISFYKFKTLSLKNDAYLRSLSLEDHKLPVYVDVNGMKLENSLDSDDFGPSLADDCQVYTTDVKVELHFKDEETLDNASDEKTPKAAQKLKNENIKDDIKTENAPTRKKRGPKKKDSSETKPSNVANFAQERQMCEECGKSVLNLKEHSIGHQSKDERRTLRCEACPKMFCTRQGLQKHYKITHLGQKSKCEICNKEVAMSGLSAHMLRKHNPSAMRFQCAACARRFLSKFELDAHMVTHTQDRAFECDVCHKMFSSKAFVSAHIRQVHEKERNYQCDLCPKAFFVKNALQEHLRSHTKELLFKCSECDKSFWTKTSLRIHRVSHSDVKRYRCDVCGKSFKRLGTLKSHIISHSDVKRYCCDLCGKSFKRDGTLKIHMISHTDIRKYRCDLCDKTFQRLGMLKSHMISHSDVKSFHCDLCDKSFKRLGILKSHMITHTKEKRYPCQFCGARFGRSIHRRRHELTAHQKHVDNAQARPVPVPLVQ